MNGLLFAPSDRGTGATRPSKPPPVVAVVEDDAAARRALGRLLLAGGFEPALFESAEAYLDASPAALCIVLDVRLPGMSGLELQQRLRAAGTSPPIIVTTASHEAAIRGRAEQMGCARFFWKPVNGYTLIAAITSLADAP
jgi:FixJ family two-component response regulator